jgi:uncharacterized protein
MSRRSPLLVNVRHLAREDQQLQGELSAGELELTGLDELIQVAEPVRYDLQVQKSERTVLARGRLSTRLTCQCVRCLRTFSLPVAINDFIAEVPLEEGQEGDFVDLTPAVREDMVLAFPQHPLCERGCAGLQPQPAPDPAAPPGQESRMTSSVWAALNNLKLD